ncbi:MAG TPA: hypothetical protein PLZ93_16810, partial [Nocardioides sp.]|nr:hypothetical protein [Nocardioides sp.]
MPSRLESAAAEDLLRLALAEPAVAAARANEVAATHDDAWTRSVVAHARGIILRDEGRTSEAVRELRSARGLARSSGDPNRLADVRATLGSALALNGQTRPGLHELDRAVDGAVDRQVRARCRMRRGYVLSMVLARHHDALVDLQSALKGVRALGDRLWEARTLNTMSLLYLDVGEVSRAERVLEQAKDIFEAERANLEAVTALHNQGALAYYRGDLPRALLLYDEAGIAYSRWGEQPVELGEDRCQALLAAGLPDDACSVAAELLSNDEIRPVDRADLELYLALGELARDDARSALAAARSARASFKRQGREIAAARAELVVLSARRRMGFGNAAKAARGRLSCVRG